jgi:hypothetical protein
VFSIQARQDWHGVIEDSKYCSITGVDSVDVVPRWPRPGFELGTDCTVQYSTVQYEVEPILRFTFYEAVTVCSQGLDWRRRKKRGGTDRCKGGAWILIKVLYGVRSNNSVNVL